MNRWKNRVAVVTGASSGIGKSIAAELAKNGLVVVGLARRLDKLQELSNELQDYQFHYRRCDVSNELETIETFQWIEKNLRAGVAVLVNNAGIGRCANLLDGRTRDWKDICLVNVIAVSTFSREAVKSMKRHGIDDGHIIHISSVAAHTSTNNSVMYKVSKHGIQILAECLRRELVAEKTNIRVTTVCPSYTKTEIFETSGAETPTNEPMLEPQDIADIVVNVLKAPPTVQISDVIVRAAGSSV